MTKIMTTTFVTRSFVNRFRFKVRFISLKQNFLNTGQGLSEPEYDFDYYLNENNHSEIVANIRRRKGVGNIDKAFQIHKKLCQDQLEPQEIYSLKQQLNEELRIIPNKTHLAVIANNSEDPQILKTVGKPRQFNFKPKSIMYLGETATNFNSELLRTENLVLTNGPRSYVLKNQLAELELAIIQYTVSKLQMEGFTAISVPDTLDSQVIENCGMTTKGKRTQVFSADCPWYSGTICLSGTSEMALGAFYSGKIMDVSNLPQKVFAVSRCYRAEVSNLREEKGIYRVHEFTKIEMFGLTANENGSESEQMLNSFTELQQNIFSEMGLHFRVLDMPSHELGASAYRKFDIETWFPPNRVFGEISSASNCTDYQSRRLNIKYNASDGSLKHVHTLNATACAIPRILMAILENFQNRGVGTINLPDCLVPFMNGKKTIGGEKSLKMVFQKLKPG